MRHDRGCFIRSIMLCLTAALLLPAAAAAENGQTSSEGKALILYYSRTGNTRLVCEVLQREINADMIEIRDMKNRHSALGIAGGMFRTLLGMRTVIEPAHVDLEPYSLIVVSSPIWAAKVTPAIRTCLETNDFSGKRVALFVTADSPLEAKYQEANIAIAAQAGAEVVGFFQVQAMRLENGKKVPRLKEDLIADTFVLAPAVSALVPQP